MKKNEVKVGGYYLAKVSGALTAVRVDEIMPNRGGNTGGDGYAVTILRSRRKTTFRSAAKFRKELTKEESKKYDNQVNTKEFPSQQLTPPTETEEQMRSDPLGQVIVSTLTDSPRPTDVPNPWKYICSRCGAEIKIDTNRIPYHKHPTKGITCGAYGEPTLVYAVKKPNVEGEQRTDPLQESGTGSVDSHEEAEHSSDPTRAECHQTSGTTTEGESVPSTSNQNGNTDPSMMNAHTVEGESTTASATSNHSTCTGSLSSKIAATRSVSLEEVAGYRPTEEQAAILAAARQPGLTVLVITAGAGAGKTSTLKMLETVLPGRGQYTAFNTSLVAESKAKFQRARCNTTHSLAFGSVGRLYAHKLGGNRVYSHEIAKVLGIESMTVSVPDPCGAMGDDGKPVVMSKTLSPGLLAGRVMKAIQKFCQSDNSEVGRQHFRKDFTGIDQPGDYTNQNAVIDALVPFARKAWADLADPNGKLSCSSSTVHDVYVKVWQLGTGDQTPVISGDYILLDEAQDTAPVFLDVLRRQSALIILVGDDNQQIYCQPEGTKVLTTIRVERAKWEICEVPIEDLKVGDSVVSYSQNYRLGRLTKKGCRVSSVTSRQVNEELVVASTDDTTSRYTKDHHCVVMLGQMLTDKWVVYMQRSGKSYRVGCCKGVYESQGNQIGPLVRAKQEDADAIWILKTFSSKDGALTEERDLLKGFPGCCFISSGGEGRCFISSGRCFILSGGEEWWEFGIENEYEAAQLLDAYDKNISEPLLTLGEEWVDRSRTPIVTAARNLIDGMLVLPFANVPYDTEDRGHTVKKFHWTPIKVDRTVYIGRVISISVDGDHTYVADGIVTHNSWRGAVNAMASFPGAPRKMLSQSFRFGQAISDVANSILAELDEPTDLVMRGCDIPSRVVLEPWEECNGKRVLTKESRAVLCRTNACAIATVLQAVKQKKRPHLIGGGAETVKFVKAAQDLQSGGGTSHPELCLFKNWREVQAYVKEDEGSDLKLMVKLIDEFKCKPILEALENMPEEEDTDLVVSTAHKSKGREWTSVRLASDFPPRNRMQDSDRRLLYVAATRAQHVLDLSVCPPFLTSMDRETGNEIPPIRIEFTKPMPTAAELEEWLDRKAIDHVSEVEANKLAADPKCYDDQKTGVVDKTQPEFTWANFAGRWRVGGPKGFEGETVDVVRKNGSSSRENLGKMVKEFPERCIYDLA